VSIGKFRDAETFYDLVQRRREAGFVKYAILVDGQEVDKAVFMDTSWETVEEVADAIVYLRFESAKVGSAGLKQEQNRIEAWIRSLLLLGSDIYSYRCRMIERGSDLVSTEVE